MRKTAATLLLSVLLAPLIGLAEYRVGVIVPLSGEVAVWGEGIKRGLDMAAAEHPGVFKFIYEDERFCDSKQALTSAKKLIELDSVSFLITGCLNGTKVIGPVAEHAGVPILSAGLLDEDSFTALHKVVSLSAQIGSEGQFLAKRLKSAGFKEVALFRHDDSFTSEYMTQFSKTSELQNGPKFLDVAVIDATFPWASELMKVRKKAPDALVVYLGNDELLGFMKARIQLKDTTPIFSGYMTESNFDAKRFGKVLDGVQYTFPDIAPENDPLRKAFESKFVQMFGASERPTVNAYFVYDGMRVLADALSRCKSAGFSCIWPVFENSGNAHKGVSGEFRFLSNGSIERGFVIKKVAGDRFEMGTTPISP